MLRRRLWHRRRGRKRPLLQYSIDRCRSTLEPYPRPPARGQARCTAQRPCRATASYNGAHFARDGPLWPRTQEISAFLAEVERRAFKQAMFAVRDEDAALDIVQDAMLKLTEKYAEKPAAELPMLFQRILQNTIHDHFRRQKVRSTWTTAALGAGERRRKGRRFRSARNFAGEIRLERDGRSRGAARASADCAA